jgi:GT2 family glycosyltransferase
MLVLLVVLLINMVILFVRGRIFDTIEKDLGQYDDEKEIFWASGACFFIRKEIYRTLNGFDDDFFAHQEEIDLCWRAFNLGFKTKYTSNLLFIMLVEQHFKKEILKKRF